MTAGLATGLARYVVAVFPEAAGGERWIALAAVWILAAAPMAGLRPSMRALALLTSWKVLALLAVAVVALTAGKGSVEHFQPFFERRPGSPPLGAALAAGLVGVFFSFGGFWEASRLGGEIRNPERTLPRALALGTAAVTFLYLLTTGAFLYLVPIQPSMTAAEFARRAGEALFAGAGPAALAAIVVLSAAASALALLLMAPRVYVAMSRDGLFPSSVASVNATTGAPTRATAVLAAIASVYVLTGSFDQIVALFLCPMLVFVALAAGGVFVLRRREGSEAPFRCPGYPATPVLFIGLLFVVVGLVAAGHPIPALAGFAIAALGLPAHRVFSRRRGRPSP